MSLLIPCKNIAINAAAVTAPSYGDGVSGLLYGDASPVYYVKEAIKGIGGSVTASSTRTSGTGGDANGASNSDLWTDPQHLCYGYAWVGVKMPAVRGITRRLTFQRGPASTGYTWRVKINWTTDYTGGSATQTPTVAGEAIVLGGGTDVSPTFEGLTPGSGSFILQALGYSDSPACFLLGMYPVAGSVVGGVGMFFGIDALEDDSFVAGCDDAPLIRSPSATPSIAGLTSEDLGTAHCYARARLGLSGAAWSPIKMLSVGSIPGSAAAEPRGNKKPIARVKYMRDAAPADSFGISRLFRWFGPVGSVPRTANRVSSKDTLVWGQLCTPWDGTEPA